MAHLTMAGKETYRDNGKCLLAECFPLGRVIFSRHPPVCCHILPDTHIRLQRVSEVLKAFRKARRITLLQRCSVQHHNQCRCQDQISNQHEALLCLFSRTFLWHRIFFCCFRKWATVISVAQTFYLCICRAGMIKWVLIRLCWHWVSVLGFSDARNNLDDTCVFADSPGGTHLNAWPTKSESLPLKTPRQTLRQCLTLIARRLTISVTSTMNVKLRISPWITLIPYPFSKHGNLVFYGKICVKRAQKDPTTQWQMRSLFPNVTVFLQFTTFCNTSKICQKLFYSLITRYLK